MTKSQKHNHYRLEIFGRECHITAVDFDEANWQQGRNIYLFYSLKNPLFKASLIEWYILMCYHHRMVGNISIVDLPYLCNERARLGRGLLETELRHIAVIAEEKERHVQRVLRRLEHEYPDIRNYIRLVVWGDLVQQTLQWMNDEIWAAFNAKGEFYNAVVSHTQLMRKGISSTEQLEAYSEFILAELPTLLHLYYSNPDGFVDIYPGKSMGFYLELEQGNFADELPQTSRFVLQAKPLIYIDAR